MRISDWTADVCSSYLESCPPAASSGASRSASGQRPESRARRYNWGFPDYLSASASARARPGRGHKARPGKACSPEAPISQYSDTTNGVSKTVPPKRQIIKDISLSFFPGAKIGLLGLNGAGKSTVLKIMAGVDTDFSGEARPQAGIKVGYLAQEPQLDPVKTVREAAEEGVGDILQAQARLDEVYAAYAEQGPDFDKLAKEQDRPEENLVAGEENTMENQPHVAADAMRLPPWHAVIVTIRTDE